MTPSTHIGLVGCGHWGRHVLRDLKTLGCRVTTVARSPASIDRAIAGGSDAIVGSIDELPDVDGAVIVSTSETHADILERLLPRGVPLFVEKPMTLGAENARRIVEIGGSRVFVMHKWRYHPGIQAIAEIANSGELGPIHALRLQQVGWGNPHPDEDVCWNLLPHCLSITLAVLGELPPPVAATGDITGTRGFTTLVAILGGHPWVSIDVSSRSPSKIRSYQVLCEDGVVELTEALADSVRITRGVDPCETQKPDNAPMELRAISTEMPLLAQVREFVEHVRGGPPPRCTAHEGLVVVEAIDQLRDLAHRSRNPRAT